MSRTCCYWLARRTLKHVSCFGAFDQQLLPACRVSYLPLEMLDQDMPVYPKKVHTPPSSHNSSPNEEKTDSSAPAVTTPDTGAHMHRYGCSCISLDIVQECLLYLHAQCLKIWCSSIRTLSKAYLPSCHDTATVTANVPHCIRATAGAPNFTKQSVRPRPCCEN